MNKVLRLALLVLVISGLVTWFVVSSSYGSVTPATGVTNNGQSICGPNAFTYAQDSAWRYVEVHTFGNYSCVSSRPGALLKVTRRKGADAGGYPNISSGYALSGAGCPSNADMLRGWCNKYDVRLGHQGHIVQDFTARTTPGYRGNVADDIWLGSSAATPFYGQRCNSALKTADTEVMVWFQHPGDLPSRSYPVKTGGRRWRVETWATSVHCPARESWRLLIFEAPAQSTGYVSVSNFAVNPLLAWAVRNGYLGEHAFLYAIDLGFEIKARGLGNTVYNENLTGVK